MKICKKDVFIVFLTYPILCESCSTFRPTNDNIRTKKFERSMLNF